MPIQYFINLTNGIEALVKFQLKLDNVSFIRIQSTWCKQKRWNDVLFTLSDDFLIKLALGYECVVFDFTAKSNEQCRAMWQGLEWIKFALNNIWFGKPYKPVGRCSSASKYFETELKYLNGKTLKKIKYYKKFLLTNELRLRSFVHATKHDGDYEYYFNILKNILGVGND